MTKLTEDQIQTALGSVRGMSQHEADTIAERAREGDAHANFALAAFLKGPRS